MNKSKLIVIIVSIVIIVIALFLIIFSVVKKNNVEVVDNNEGENIAENNVQIYQEEKTEIKEEVKKDTKVDVVNIESNSRPYAVAINNTPVAVQVQESLNRAYIVYEIPTEGNTSRLLALYKDIEEDLVIGTVRSARHNFIDYALESDAIFCCFGWSHYAESDMRAGSINYLQGLFGYPYYRNNPNGLATEHTAYTSMAKLKDAANNNGFRQTTETKPILNYDTEDVDLSNINNIQVANQIVIPYGASPNIASFSYDSSTKMYIRYEDSNMCIDHNTKESVTTKNIIVQKITYNQCDDGYYWNLHTVGSGEGYYITNGYALPITWKKDSRNSKTVYSYKQGTIINGVDVSQKELVVSDGRTWIEIQTTSQNLDIK